jgi:hypothetical protein
MLFFRAALLEFLVCFHVIGAAVLFRRFFPRESPWLGFFLPTLAVMAVFNFAEHFVALPVLGWLLPISGGGLLWAMLRPGYTWTGLRLPAVLFVIAFTFALGIKCMQPEVSSNGEGTADLTRVLDFSLGGTLPPIDCWMPPYDHGGYYEFQHYGAALLKRLLWLDIGTAYNIGFTLLNALVCLVGAGVAYRISGGRIWVTVATLLLVMASFTGSAPIVFFHNFNRLEWPDFRLSVDIHESWQDPVRNPFRWYLAGLVDHPTLRLFPPGYNIYCNEFHANLGGHFFTLAALLAGVEAFRRERSNWPWVGLIVFPFFTIITSAWFFFVVAAFAFGALAVALLMGRRPQNWTFVLMAAAVACLCLWPSVSDLMSGTAPLPIFWTPKAGRTPFWTFIIQWWPVWVPWLALLFVWRRMPPFGRWMHLAVAVMLIWVEFVTVGDRGLTIEKMWGGIYGAALVTLLPLVFIQPGAVFRAITVALLFCTAICLGGWTKLNHDWVDWNIVFMHLEGDTFITNDPPKKRLLQVMKRLHAVTILPGKSDWSYTPTPAIVTFSENRSYIAWYYQEIQCGHGGEADYRNKANNDFYDGTLPAPLAFLEDNDISAVLIWPDDNIPDDLLARMKRQIGVDYYYVDCRAAGGHNAGLFIRRPVSRATEAELNPSPAPTNETANPAAPASHPAKP